jgi:type IV secretory pathway component VirB8
MPDSRARSARVRQSARMAAKLAVSAALLAILLPLAATALVMVFSLTGAVVYVVRRSRSTDARFDGHDG